MLRSSSSSKKRDWYDTILANSHAKRSAEKSSRVKEVSSTALRPKRTWDLDDSRTCGRKGRPVGEDPKGEDPMGEDRMGEDPMGEDLMGEDPMGEDPMGKDPCGVPRRRALRRVRRGRVGAWASVKSVSVERVNGTHTARAATERESCRELRRAAESCGELQRAAESCKEPSKSEQGSESKWGRAIL